MTSAADRAAVRKFQRTEHFRAMSNAHKWDPDDQPSERRTCPMCQRTLPDTSGYWPPFMSMPAQWTGDVPCNDCLPAALASFRPLC